MDRISRGEAKAVGDEVSFSTSLCTVARGFVRGEQMVAWITVPLTDTGEVFFHVSIPQTQNTVRHLESFSKACNSY